jgi:hypothetical protein
MIHSAHHLVLMTPCSRITLPVLIELRYVLEVMVILLNVVLVVGFHLDLLNCKYKQVGKSKAFALMLTLAISKIFLIFYYGSNAGTMWTAFNRMQV